MRQWCGGGDHPFQRTRSMGWGIWAPFSAGIHTVRACEYEHVCVCMCALCARVYICMCPYTGIACVCTECVRCVRVHVRIACTRVCTCTYAWVPMCTACACELPEFQLPLEAAIATLSSLTDPDHKVFKRRHKCHNMPLTLPFPPVSSLVLEACLVHEKGEVSTPYVWI